MVTACMCGCRLRSLRIDVLAGRSDRFLNPDHRRWEIAGPARPLAFEAQQLERLKRRLAIVMPSE